MATYADRRVIERRLRAEADAIAESVTDEFLARHPDWLDRFGRNAYARGIEDARFHIDFLAGALLSGDAAPFEHYAVWTARVLSARGIDPIYLIENLEQIAEHAGRRLADVDRYEVRRILAAGAAAIRHGTPASDPDTGEEVERFGPERRFYLHAAFAGDRRAAWTVALEAIRGGASVIDVYQDILQPAQYEVGRLWERNAVTAAREHVATAVTQHVIARLYEELPTPATMRGNALVTGVRGELHQVGANMVADVLEADGWRMRFLGTHLPHRDILNAIDDHTPELIGISATVLSNLTAVGDLIEDVRRNFGERVQVIVGGGAFRFNADAWRDLGADGIGRDLRDARDVVQRLLPSPAG